MTDADYTLQQDAAPQRGRKYFTLAEARRALPLVKRIAADARTAQLERLRINGELTGPRNIPAQESAGLRRDLKYQTERLEQLVAELTQIGVELKDPLRGLLDFPAVHDRRAVYLCWENDEETITHWHEIDAGFAGRQSVTLLHEKA